LSLNAFKWIGGSPGIIESNSLVTYSLIFIIAIRYGSTFAATTSILIVGALAAFLIFAFPPPKIFSGSSGRTTYGFLVCVLALIADAKMATTIMLIILPLIDFAYVVIQRYLVHRPINPLDILKINDTTHLHHQFLKMGYTRKQVVLIETAMTLLLSSIAVLSTGAIRFFIIILVLLAAILLVLIINIQSQRKQKQKAEKESPESKYSY
jgi:UDP-GlcNAc:undecaprenyl-phosphate GlcNAc-1-phosphate transferase